MSEGMKRRDFLKVMGASGATVAAAGCGTAEAERLIPYVVPAEEIVPGVPTWYASTCRECPAGCGIHVETHSGRATKVEGNPGHPVNHGNLCARGQSSVQGLYHPDRYQGPSVREDGIDAPRNVTWTAAERLVAERIQRARQAGRAGGVVFLTQSYGGSMDRLVDAFVGAVGGRRVVYEPLERGPRDLDFADADYLVSFGADFLETWGSPVDYSWQFAQMRDHRVGTRGKFVWVGPHRPLTGLNADQWIAPKPGTEAIVAQVLAGDVAPAAAAQQTGVDAGVLERLATEFRAARKKVVMGPGASITGRNAAALQATINRLNGRGGTTAAVGRLDQVVRLVEEMRTGQVEVLLVDAPNPVYTLPGALKFGDAMQRVPTRVSFSTFPDETSRLATLLLPDHHFLEKWDDYVPTPGVFELVQPVMRPVFNTKQVGDVLLSVARLLGTDVGGGAATYYEYLRAIWTGRAGGADAWRTAVKNGGVYPAAGRGTGAAGFLPLVQPGAGSTVLPATAAAGQARPGNEGAGVAAGAGLEGRPAVAPAAAGATGVAPAPATPAPAAPAPAAAGPLQPITFEGSADATFHLVVYPSYRFYDGRTANRPWLLELPDPVTKVSWNSWVEIHPRAARQLGVEQGEILEVASPYGTLRAPAFVWPGVREDAVAVQMGLGHEAFGRYTEGVGVNPNALLSAAVDPASGGLAPYGLRVKVTPTGEQSRPLQGMFEYGVRVQHDREVAQAVSLVELAQAEQKGPGRIPGEGEEITTLRGFGGFAPRTQETDPDAYPPPGTHYGEYLEGETRWAMAVDLSRCIGCSACVVACFAENNIPMVGPSEMAKGRELHWLRIERYFGVTRDEGEAYEDDGTDDTRFLPMLCQHCGNAPCEPVCPVYAAYHTPDGLNGQIYNRCVGTRYCANNCPWKVRYFNWFTYEFAEPLNWQLNPDVAVREKGVMEKCTFCVQRIREAERTAAMENRPTRDGDVVPACVQTCPTEVFVFGNIADPKSAVAQASRSHRSYRTLEVLNTQPAIVYLKKVTLSEPARTGHEAPAGAGYDPSKQETH